MNLFIKCFFSVLFFISLLNSTVYSRKRISDKRKCADADCSRPISQATTLIPYFADDDRLLSFPRNVKVKVFSKEAGDIPDLWEVEINGKRGYVPKTFLRENKVFIPSNKLTYIVPTGRMDSAKPNVSSENQIPTESNSMNLLSATPKLPAANSKGFFSTIGGVSADSVPMNSPDINPQSTRKFQVIGGTTVYDDVISEKPESPPIVIDDVKDGNKESEKKSPDATLVPQDSNVPSSDIKPVNENIDENEMAIETEKEIKDKQKDLGTKPEEKDIQPEEGFRESAKGTNMFNDIVNTVTNFISSGAGENSIEEEIEEDIGDEEDGDGNGEGDEDNENEIKGLMEEKPGVGQTRPELQSLNELRENTSEIPSVINNEDKRSATFKPGLEPKLEEKNTVNRENEELAEKNNDEQDNEFLTGSIKVSDNNQSIVKPKSKEDEQSIVQNPSQGKDESLYNRNQDDKSEPTLHQSSDIVKGEILDPPEAKTLVSNPDHVHEQSTHEGISEEIGQITGGETTEENSLEKENTIERIGDQSGQTSELEVNTESKQPETRKILLSNELQHLEQHDASELRDHKQPKNITTEVQQELKINQSQAQDQPKIDIQNGVKIDITSQAQHSTDDLKHQEETKNIESQVLEPNTTLESQLQEHPNNDTQSDKTQPVARQLLFGPRQGRSSEKTKLEITKDTLKTEPPITHATPLISESHDDKSEVESLNDTAKEDLSATHPTFSSLQTTQSTGSPKYASYVNRQIQGSGGPSVNEMLPHSEHYEEEDEKGSDPQIQNTIEVSESTSAFEEPMSPNLSLQSQSPKYNAIVSNQIGSVTPPNNVESETIPESPVVQTHTQVPADINTEKELPNVPYPNTESHIVSKSAEEMEVAKGEIITDNSEVLFEDLKILNDVDAPPSDIVGDTLIETASEEGMFSWIMSIFDVFGSKDSSSSELPVVSETLDSSKITHFTEETCSTDAIEGSCPTLEDTMQKEVTWQETVEASDMWELLDKIPLEATIWLIITAVVVLVFSLGHYYIEAHRRDGPLVAIINKLEREVLILKKERSIMEDRLSIAEQQLDTWNTSSSENDALLVELKQELEETKAAKTELEEQVGQLKDELETVTESGLEMHRLLEESLSSQDGSQVLLSTVETLREKLHRQEEEISGLSDTLSSKNAEVAELQGKLVQSAEVARSLEDKVISVIQEKDEELLKLRDKHRELISQLEEVMETKALEETRLSTEMSKLRLTIEELQKALADKDSELETLKEVVKQLRSTDSNEKMEALFDVVSVQAKLKIAIAERDEFREKFSEEEGARKLLEGHMKKITQEVLELKNSFEAAEKEKIEALTKLQVLSNYFKEKESQLQKELGLQESMWLQKQSDDHTIYEQMRSLREENEKYKLQNESLKKEIVEQEASFKIQLANTEQKAHENWVSSRQAERKLKESQQEAAQLRNRLTTVEKNSANYTLDEKPNISESNGDPSSPPPSLMFPPTTSPPFMMYGPPIPPPGDFVPPPPLMGSPYPPDSRPPPLGRISSPPLDHRFSPPPPLPYPPYDYTPYGHHSPSPPPPLPSHHRNVHKPQPREMSRDQKDHVPNYSPEAEKTLRRNNR